MMASLNHVGLYVSDIEVAKSFFETYFGATSGVIYHNSKKSFSSYMLSFGDGTRLEIMTKPALKDVEDRTGNYGYAHISISVGSRERVETITQRLVDNGYRHLDGPRTTGDGYYESAILDTEGNVIEITI